MLGETTAVVKTRPLKTDSQSSDRLKMQQRDWVTISKLGVHLVMRIFGAKTMPQRWRVKNLFVRVRSKLRQVRPKDEAKNFRWLIAKYTFNVQWSIMLMWQALPIMSRNARNRKNKY